MISLDDVTSVFTQLLDTSGRPQASTFRQVAGQPAPDAGVASDGSENLASQTTISGRTNLFLQHVVRTRVTAIYLDFR